MFFIQLRSQMMRRRTCRVRLSAALFSLIFLLFGLLFGHTIRAAETYSISENLQHYLSEAAEWHDTTMQHQLLLDFYQSRQFMPMWVNPYGPLPRAEELLRTLRDADHEGLDSRAYSIKLLELLWQTPSPAVLARLELRLSNAALEYGRDLQVGRYPPEKTHSLWYIPVAQFDGGALLESLASSEDIRHTLASLAPPHPEYWRLRGALNYYRQLALLGGWPTIPLDPILRVGDKQPQVALLRQRLFIEGDLVLDVREEEHTFDELLKMAVERFQVRHGLKVDGVAGPATLAAMNIPVEQRIEQLKINMNRWRWLPRDLGKRYILVNIPEFQLRAYEENRLALVMDVIVGREDRPTPVISGRLHSVVFNPYWTAPPIIIVKDLIPKQLRNPDFMSQRNIRVYQGDTEIDPRSVEWRRIKFNYLPYVLRQDPDPHNPMGKVKFLFHNNLDIYLHDTPDTGLFHRDVRTLSSGCIRVSQPAELTSFILAGNNGWNENAIRRAFASDDTQTVTLDTALPVYLLYLTAWVGNDNRAHFRNDVYRVDESIPACYGPGELIAETVD